MGFSPGCSSIVERSIVDVLIRAGVPVFNLPIGSLKLDNRFASFFDASSVCLPPSTCLSP